MPRDQEMMRFSPRQIFQLIFTQFLPNYFQSKIHRVFIPIQFRLLSIPKVVFSVMVIFTQFLPNFYHQKFYNLIFTQFLPNFFIIFTQFLPNYFLNVQKYKPTLYESNVDVRTEIPLENY